MTASPFFHTHVHSQFSSLDAMSKVPDLVRRAAINGQPAASLTDHGNMAGAVKLYKESKKYDIKPFIGVEGYLIDPRAENWETPDKGQKIKRYHLNLLALDEDGYKGLVKFVSMTHTRPRFSRFPRFTISDLAEFGQTYGESVALMTGCFFGLVQQTLMNDGVHEAQRMIEMLHGWFPNTYVELHNHNIDHGNGRADKDNAEDLYTIAQTLGLPVVGAQDNHYENEREKAAHALLKRMTYGGTDDEFPGDPFHLASTEWMREHFTVPQWLAIEDGCQDLLDKHDLHIKPLDTFVVDVPSMPGVPFPKSMMMKNARKGLTDYLKKQKITDPKTVKIYWDRLDYEFSVIDHLNMWGYFVIWLKFVIWCRQRHIAIEARGSANGSLVLFTTGVTQVDPILWDVDYERFLSIDRVKPPDVDMDIEDAERPGAVQHLLSLFGAVQIGTYSKLGTKIDPDTGEEKGSVMVSWLASKRRECEDIALKRFEDGKLEKKGDVHEYAQRIFSKKFGHITSIEGVEAYSPVDGEGIRILAEMNSVFKSYGVHASGILLPGNNYKIEDYIPTMLVASSNTRVTQFEQDDVEEFGLLKMDILGQATLRLMKLAQQSMGKTDPTDFGWIPNDDPDACKLLREGRTNTGIFHFDGFAKAKGGRELGVKSTADSILVHALYMPGAMDVAPGQKLSAKDHYIKARKDPVFRKNVVYENDVLRKNLAPTYGAFVFQNQVLAILRDLGMDIPTVNVFLKIVKDSGAGAYQRNTERAKNVHAEYTRLAKQAGVIDTEGLWNQLTTFAAYGFNKAHATGYGIRSYRCAFLKAHHELEFMQGLLVTWAGRKKEILYIREARRIGVKLLPPHVNVSTDTWTIDRQQGVIRKGLVSILGIGEPTAKPIHAGAPYTSISDMVDRLPPRVISGGAMFIAAGKYSGTLAKLRDAGAIDGLPELEEE